jgi:hypothetical protein
MRIIVELSEYWEPNPITEAPVMVA